MESPKVGISWRYR